MPASTEALPSKPLSNQHWLLPLRLAFVTMTLTVALIAAITLATVVTISILLHGISVRPVMHLYLRRKGAVC